MTGESGRVRIAAVFVGFGLYAAAVLVLLGSGPLSAASLDGRTVVPVATGVGAAGALAWWLIAETCEFGSYRARGGVAGVVVGFVGPSVAVFSYVLLLAALGQPEPGFLPAAVGLSVRLGIASLPFVGWATVPFGAGTGLVLAHVLGPSSEAET